MIQGELEVHYADDFLSNTGFFACNSHNVCHAVRTRMNELLKSRLAKVQNHICFIQESYAKVQDGERDPSIV